MAGTPITTTDRGSALLRLTAWLSPAFPVGGFSYSHGLERVVHDGLVGDQQGLADWIGQLVTMGSGWNDAVLFAEAWRQAAASGDLRPVAELAEALAPSRERHTETMLQGKAFVDAARAWALPAGLPENCAYCVAVGASAGASGIALDDALAVFLQAFATNLVQAGIRLGVCGQSGGLAIVAGCESLILKTVARAATSTLDDLGSATMISDIMAMRHETQRSRLFRS